MHYQRRVFERYLTPTEERALLATVGALRDVLARRDHAWMRLLRQTGLRVGALAGLTVYDAKEALREGRLASRPEISKGSHGYSVPVNKKAAAALKELLAIRREQGYAEIPDEPLILSRKHRAMSVRSFQARMQMWRRQAGLSVEASPHWFRHTLSKRILARSTAREPLRVVQAVLGHASPSSTSIYTLPDREEIAQAVEEAA